MLGDLSETTSASQDLFEQSRVHQTGGNWSGLTAVRPGSGLGWYQIGPNSKFKFKFKINEKISKNPRNTSRCDDSNGVKFSKKFIYLV